MAFPQHNPLKKKKKKKNSDAETSQHFLDMQTGQETVPYGGCYDTTVSAMLEWLKRSIASFKIRLSAVPGETKASLSN